MASTLVNQVKSLELRIKARESALRFALAEEAKAKQELSEAGREASAALAEEEKERATNSELKSKLNLLAARLPRLRDEVARARAAYSGAEEDSAEVRGFMERQQP